MTPKTYRILTSIREALGAAVMPHLSDGNARAVLTQTDDLLNELLFRESCGRALLFAKLEEARALLAEAADLGVESSEVCMPQLSADSALPILADAYTSAAAALNEVLLKAGTGIDHVDLMQRISVWELDYYRQQIALTSTRMNTALDAPTSDPTADEIERYLFPRMLDAAHRVTEVRRVPGGYSKLTSIIDLISPSNETMRIVMRRNQAKPASQKGCYSLSRENALLLELHQRGLKVPRPLWYEGDRSHFGSDFAMSEFMEGESRGSHAGANEAISEALLSDLALVLAELHSIDTRECADLLSNIYETDVRELTVAERNAQIVKENFAHYRSEGLNSPACSYAFQRLAATIPLNDDRCSIVHGDPGFHNFLVKDDRISAMLDWEGAQVGDPAYDLGQLKSVVTPHMPWPRFMELYREAGGPHVSDESIRFQVASIALRNAYMSHVVTRSFDRGEINEVKIAALGVKHLPRWLIEACDNQLAPNFIQDGE